MSWQVGLYVAAVLIPLAAFTIELLLARLLGRFNAVVATGAIGLSFLLSLVGGWPGQLACPGGAAARGQG